MPKKQTQQVVMESKTDNLALQLKQACQLYIDDYFFFRNPLEEVARKVIQFIDTHLSVSALTDFEEILTKELILGLLFHFRGIEAFMSKVSHLSLNMYNDNLYSKHKFFRMNFCLDFMNERNLGQQGVCLFSGNLMENDINITSRDFRLIFNFNKANKEDLAGLVLRMLFYANQRRNSSFFCKILKNPQYFNEILSVDVQRMEYCQFKSIVLGSFKDDLLHAIENPCFNEIDVYLKFLLFEQIVKLSLKVNVSINTLDNSCSLLSRTHFYWEFISPTIGDPLYRDSIKHILRFNPTLFLQGGNLTAFNYFEFVAMCTNVIKSLIHYTSEQQKELKKELNPLIWDNHAKYVANASSFFQPRDIASVIISKYAEVMNYSV